VNAADLARLEIAKRAYTAAQPRATEVQTGVRRARLSLRRVKPRRSWFDKGLVLVVLAVGSLAYAKPHAISELVENFARPGGASTAKHGGSGVSASAVAQLPAKMSISRAHATELASAPSVLASAPSVDAPPQASTPALRQSHEPAPRAVGAPVPVQGSRGASKVAASAVKGAALAAEVAAPADKTLPTAAAVSDWGRVAQALTRGDETQALAALSELSDSNDQRTRDKADLGRAQLFIAHGDSDKGCALVRSLSNRRAGSHIERQARLLLKSCTR
jgi:hypothetical protein